MTKENKQGRFAECNRKIQDKTEKKLVSTNEPI